MTRKIKVRLVPTTRDGWVRKWINHEGRERQRRCYGRTQRARETERRKLEEELNDQPARLSWVEFWEMLDESHLEHLSQSHQAKCRTMKKRLEAAAEARGIERLRCGDIDAALLQEVEAEQHRLGNELATIRSNMNTLWAVLSWGQERGLIPELRRPRPDRSKRAKQVRSRRSKGRPLVGEELERMEAAIPLVCKTLEDPDGFLRAMNVMRLIGMRKAEAWMFAWEPEPGAHFPMLLDSKTPAVQFHENQKSGVEQIVPLTPEAAAWLRSLPRGDSPWVCRTRGPKGWHKTPDRMGRVIGAAGRKARIMVKEIVKSDGRKLIKYASAHDLRRTFARDLHRRLGNVTEAKHMTRHADAQTLLDYYDDDVATPRLVAELSAKLARK